MIEVNKAATEREAHAKVLKAEIRSKMEQIDTLKLSILKHEYDLYKLYSRLDDLDSEINPDHMEKNKKRSAVSEKNRETVGCVMQAG